MNSKLELSWEEVQKLANELVLKVTGSHLSDIETEVLHGASEGKTYDEIAKELYLSGIYINKDVGNPLWKNLSKALEEEVTKKNFRQALKRYKEKQSSLSFGTHNPVLKTYAPLIPTSADCTVPLYESLPMESLELPGGRMAIDSCFYIERHDVESLCYETIKQPGALIRIKAPEKMGKTSLLERIFAEAVKQDYQVVNLSFATDSTVFPDIHKFLRCFCACVSKRLRMPNKLDDYWDDIFGCNDNATNYFEEYLLAERANPLVLALDQVDLVFEKTEIANDFCRLIRAWHDLSTRSNERGRIWKKLRLVIVHSTEVYSSLDINYSPLQGVGRVVALEEFTLDQVIELARRYKLNWVGTEVEQVMDLVGGHPHLVRLALDYLKRQNVSLEKLLQIASTEASPFRDHLRQHLWNLQQHPELAAAFREVVTVNTPVRLKSAHAFKLQSMGLVKTQSDESDDWSPRCNLYRQYFSRQLVEI
jgi:AAA-like domain